MMPSGVSTDMKDIGELMKALKHAVSRIVEGDHDGAQAALRFAKGIVNVSDFLEPHAKAIMTSVFAEFSSIIDPFSTDADVLFDNFVRSMEFIYGDSHIVMSDCYTMMSSYYASCDRLPLAIEFAGRALANRIAAVGLMHTSTAHSHYNLGLIYRLNGQLVQSKRELRICRSILSSVHGEESIEVAKIDISLGQTERLLIAYDKAYLHFFLAFRARAIILGPCHPQSLRAYQLLHCIRSAYSDRLICSVELLDRLEELGWFDLLGNSKSEGGDEDVFVVISSLLTRVYADRANSGPMQTHGSIGIFSYKTGMDSGGGSAGSLLGDCLVLRESKLKSMVQMSVAERVHSLIDLQTLGEQQSFDVMTDLTDEASAVVSPQQPTRITSRQAHDTSSKLLSLSFSVKENIVPLTQAIMTILFPPVDKKLLLSEMGHLNKSAHHTHTAANVTPMLLQAGQVDYYQQQMNKRIQILGAKAFVEQQLHDDFTSPRNPAVTEENKQSTREDYGEPNGSAFTMSSPPSAPPPLEGGASLDDTMFAPPPTAAEASDKKPLPAENKGNDESGGYATPGNGVGMSNGKCTKTRNGEDGVAGSRKKMTGSDGKVRGPPIHNPVKPKTPVAVIPKYNIRAVVNRNKNFDDVGDDDEEENVASTPSAAVGKRRSVDPMNSSDSVDAKGGTPLVSGKAPQRSSTGMHGVVVASQVSSVTREIASLSKSHTQQKRKMPVVGNRKLIISKDSAGKRVTIRPTTGKDIIDALRIKLFTTGIFPYLLLTDVDQVERDSMIANAAKSFDNPSLLRDRRRASAMGKTPAQLEAEAKKNKEAEEEEARKKKAEEEAQLLKKRDEESSEKNSDDTLEEQKKDISKKAIPRPPPLPTLWPPQVVDGKNVGGDSPLSINMADVLGGGRGGGGRGDLLGALLGGRGGGGRGGPLAFLRRKSGGNFKPMGPKLKQLHWDTLATTEGTLWADESETGAAPNVTDEVFADLADVFAPAQKKAAGDKKESKPVLQKSKQVAVLDGQKSQNMNIMLAKFGSRRKISEIILAIVTLEVESFTLPSVMTMLDFTPASFADTGEVEAIKAVINSQGMDKLGKAERYLHELAKIPRVDNYLRVLALLLSVEDVKNQTASAATTVIRAADEVRGSARLKTMFKAILKIGNILNQGTKKSGATGFKISSLPKLTQTKSNSGETVLEYMVMRLARDTPDVLDVKADMPSLEEAKYVNFSTLQLDISKLETGVKILVKLKEDIKKTLENGPSPEIGATDAVYAKLCSHEGRVTEVLQELKDMMTRAQECHSDLCLFLGEDAKLSDPEKLYGELFAFVNSVESVIIRKLKRV